MPLRLSVVERLLVGRHPAERGGWEGKAATNRSERLSEGAEQGAPRQQQAQQQLMTIARSRRSSGYCCSVLHAGCCSVRRRGRPLVVAGRLLCQQVPSAELLPSIAPTYCRAASNCCCTLSSSFFRDDLQRRCARSFSRRWCFHHAADSGDGDRAAAAADQQGACSFAGRCQQQSSSRCCVPLKLLHARFP